MVLANGAPKPVVSAPTPAQPTPAQPTPIPVTTKAATTNTSTNTYLNNQGQSFNTPQTLQQGNANGPVGVGTAPLGGSSGYTNTNGQQIQTVFQNPNGSFSDLYGNPIAGATTQAEAQLAFNQGATGVISGSTAGLATGQTVNALPPGIRPVSATSQSVTGAPPPSLFGGQYQSQPAQLQSSGTGGFSSSTAQGLAVYGPVAVENNVAQTFSTLYGGIEPIVVSENPNGSVSISIRSDFKDSGAQAVLVGAIQGATANNPYATATRTGPNSFVINPGAGPSAAAASPITSNNAPVTLDQGRAAAITLASGLRQSGVAASDIVYGGTATAAVNPVDFSSIDSSLGFLSTAPVLGKTFSTSAPNEIVVNPGTNQQIVFTGTGTPATGVTYNPPYKGLDILDSSNSVTFTSTGTAGGPSGAVIVTPASQTYPAGPSATLGNVAPSTIEPGGTLTNLAPVAVYGTPSPPTVFTPTEQFAHQTAANPNPLSTVKFVVLPPVVAGENTGRYRSGFAYYGTPQNTFDTYLQQVGTASYQQTNPGQPGAENAVKDIVSGLAIGTVITGARALNFGGQVLNENPFAPRLGPNPAQGATPAQREETTSSGIALAETVAPLVVAPLVIGAAGAGVAAAAGVEAANTLGIGLELGFAAATGAQVGTIKDSKGKSYIDPGRFLVGAAIPIGVGEGIPLLEGKTGPLTQATAARAIGEPAVVMNLNPTTNVQQEGEVPLGQETFQSSTYGTQAQFDISARQLYGYKVPNFVAQLLGSSEPGVAFPSYRTFTYSEPVEQLGTISSFEQRNPAVTTTPGYLEPSPSNPQGEAAPFLAQSETFAQGKNVGLPTPSLASLQASTAAGPYAENIPQPSGLQAGTPTNELPAGEINYNPNEPAIKVTFGPRSFTFGQGSAYYQIQPTVEEAIGLPTLQPITGGVNKALSNIGTVEYASTGGTEQVQLTGEAPSTAQGPVVSSFRSLTYQESPNVGGERQLSTIRSQPEYTLLFQSPNEEGGTTNVFEQTYQGTTASTLAPTKGALTNIEGTLTVNTLKPSGPPNPLLPSDVYPSAPTGTGAGPNIDIFGPPTVGGGTGGAGGSAPSAQLAGGISEQSSSAGTSVAQRLGGQAAPNVLPDFSGAQTRGEQAIGAQLQTPNTATSSGAGFVLGLQAPVFANSEELTLPSQQPAPQGTQERTSAGDLTKNGLRVLPITIPSVNTDTGQKTGSKTGQVGQTITGQRTGGQTDTGFQTDSGFRIGGNTDIGQRQDTGQKTGQAIVQSQQQAQQTQQLTIPALPPPVDTGFRPPTPPPPIPPQIPVGIPTVPKEEGQNPQEFELNFPIFGRPSKRQPAGVLPDIFSASASQAEFGSATAGFLENTPELGGRANALSGSVPTLEEIRYEKTHARGSSHAARPSVGVKGADFGKGGFKLKF